MWTVRYFKSKQYNWSGISEQPSLLAKAKRGLLQFTPYSWDDFEWHVFSSPKRCVQARPAAPTSRSRILCAYLCPTHTSPFAAQLVASLAHPSPCSASSRWASSCCLRSTTSSSNSCCGCRPSTRSTPTASPSSSSLPCPASRCVRVMGYPRSQVAGLDRDSVDSELLR